MPDTLRAPVHKVHREGMAEEPPASRSFVGQHLDVLRHRPRAAIGLGVFCLAMGVGIWFGTVPLDSVGTRVFCVVLGVLTMVWCGIGYLFPGNDES
jgi:hypothetical protein